MIGPPRRALTRNARGATLPDEVEMGWMLVSPVTASQGATLAVLKQRFGEISILDRATIIGVDLAKKRS